MMSSVGEVGMWLRWSREWWSRERSEPVWKAALSGQTCQKEKCEMLSLLFVDRANALLEA